MDKIDKAILIKRLESDANSLNAIACRPDVSRCPFSETLLFIEQHIFQAIDMLKGGEEMK